MSKKYEPMYEKLKKRINEIKFELDKNEMTDDEALKYLKIKLEYWEEESLIEIIETNKKIKKES